MEFPKPIPFLLLLCFMCLSSNSARLLDEQPQLPVGTSAASNVVGTGTPASSSIVGTGTSASSSVVGTGTSASSSVVGTGTSASLSVVGTGTSASSSVVGTGTSASSSVVGTGSSASSSVVGTPVGNLGTGTTTTTPSTTLPSSGGIEDDHHTLTFFMHDILGGSNPSARAVTGAVNNPALNGQLPFAKPNGAVLSVGNNVPQSNGNSGLINNNNLPFLIGLGGATSPLLQNNNGGGNNFNGALGFPSVNAGQLPSGVSVQQLLFGTMTVIDDELTEGHELNSGLIGKAQGFYVVSSEDGNSQTMAFTTMFESGHYVDSLSFFGVHRTAVSESHLAIMGGTGKYVNAKGFANVKTLPGINQQETDGVETLLQFTVYISY